MESQNPRKSIKRHVLCEMNNTRCPRTSRTRGKVKFTGFPNIEKLIYHDEKGSTQDNESFEKQKEQKQASSEPPYVYHGNTTEIKDAQRGENIEMKENQSLTSQLQVLESAFLKEKKPIYPIEESNVRIKMTETMSEKELKKQKFQDHLNSNGNENFSPILTNLICKSKVDKITRPPNAFMLFAKEHRQKVREDHPLETNRGISIILGNMWRAMNNESKTKYYHDANALEKLHKQKYPEYVYCPSEARRQKQSRIQNRSKQKESTPVPGNLPNTVKNDIFSHRPDFGLSGAANDQEASLHSPIGMPNPSINEFCKNDGYSSMEKCLNSSKNPLHSPLYWPFISKWSPGFDNSPPFTGTPPFCHCQAQGSSQTVRAPLSTHQHSPFKMSYPCPPTKFNHPYPTFPSPMIHPAIWNPWLMFPSPYYPTNSTPFGEELHKNWMARHPLSPSYFENVQAQQQTQQNISKTHESKSPDEDSAKPSESQTAVMSDDDSVKSLVIVEASEWL